MSDLALFLVRTGFLVVMWIFVFTIISVIRADLFGQRVVSKVAEANAPRVVSAPIARVAPTVGVAGLSTGAMPQLTQPQEDKTEPTHLVVTEGPRAGFSLKLLDLQFPGLDFPAGVAQNVSGVWHWPKQPFLGTPRHTNL